MLSYTNLYLLVLFASEIFKNLVYIYRSVSECVRGIVDIGMECEIDNPCSNSNRSHCIRFRTSILVNA